MSERMTWEQTEITKDSSPSDDENLTARAGRGSVDAMTPDERLTWEQICERYPEQFVDFEVLMSEHRIRLEPVGGPC